MRKTQRFVKRSLFIFGSFSFGWVLGIVLHELGHAIAMWITGGVVDQITITPFSWSYTYYGSTPKYPQFTTWSGILIGSILGLVVLFSVRKRTTPYLVPLVFTGLAPMLHGGGYYLVDTFVSKKGDAASLIQSGVPKHVVFGVGLLFLAMGLYFVIKYIYRCGIKPQDTFIKRVVLLASGILPYFVLSLIYKIVKVPDDTLDDIFAIVMVACFVVFIAWASLKYSKPEKSKMSTTSVEWHHVVYATVLGVFAIVVPHMIFAR